MDAFQVVPRDRCGLTAENDSAASTASRARLRIHQAAASDGSPDTGNDHMVSRPSSWLNASVPAGLTRDGLPIGAHLAGPWGEERRLLELAYLLEGA